MKTHTRSLVISGRVRISYRAQIRSKKSLQQAFCTSHKSHDTRREEHWLKEGEPQATSQRRHDTTIQNTTSSLLPKERTPIPQAISYGTIMESATRHSAFAPGRAARPIERMEDETVRQNSAPFFRPSAKIFRESPVTGSRPSYAESSMRRQRLLSGWGGVAHLKTNTLRVHKSRTSSLCQHPSDFPAI